MSTKTAFYKLRFYHCEPQVRGPKAESSAKETRMQSKQTRKFADDGGTQWFEDTKKLPEIDSLQFVL